MNKKFLLFIIGCFAVTASCATPEPKLKFFKLAPGYSTEDIKGKLTFKMPSPVITISDPDQKNEKDPSSWEPVFTSSVRSGKEMYAIESADPWYIETKYTIAYQQNSFLLKSLNIDLTDNRLKYIQDVGTIAATIIPFVAGVPFKAAPPPKPPGEAPEQIELRKNLPYSVDVARCFGTTLDEKAPSGKVSCEVPITDRNGKDIGWKAIIVTDNNNKNSTVSYDDLFTKEGKVSTDFPVPDCKEGFVYLQFKDDPKLFSSPITFTNPTRLTSVPMPAKGTITYHPICSADTTSSAAEIAKPIELLKTTVDQIAAAKKAWDDAHKNK
jgi:hypothetical protein